MHFHCAFHVLTVRLMPLPGPSRSFGFSGECLGQHSGSDQAANLGDGNGESVLYTFLA